MNTILKVFVVSWLLVLSSSLLEAQCPVPAMKTAVIMVNGILVPNSGEWQKQVQKFGDNFLSSHPLLNSACVIFVPIYNQSDGMFRDVLQSRYQLNKQRQDVYYANWTSLLANNTDHELFMAAAMDYAVNPIILTSDMDSIKNAVTSRWSQGYRVILFGHSQGTLFTNKAYNDLLNIMINQLPNPNKLVVVNIATPANNVADGRQAYTSECKDFIHYVPGSLSPNVGLSNSQLVCNVIVVFETLASWVAKALKLLM